MKHGNTKRKSKGRRELCTGGSEQRSWLTLGSPGPHRAPACSGAASVQAEEWPSENSVMWRQGRKGRVRVLCFSLGCSSLTKLKFIFLVPLDKVKILTEARGDRLWGHFGFRKLTCKLLCLHQQIQLHRASA